MIQHTPSFMSRIRDGGTGESVTRMREGKTGGVPTLRTGEVEARVIM